MEILFLSEPVYFLHTRAVIGETLTISYRVFFGITSIFAFQCNLFSIKVKKEKQKEEVNFGLVVIWKDLPM